MTRRISCVTCIAMALLGVLVFELALGNHALARPVASQPGAKGNVTLPYRPPQTDLLGNQWFVYQGGWFRQQGNMPVYSEGAQLLVNGSQASSATNQARLEDNGELVMDNMNIPGATVTRRILFNREENYIRVIDIFKNAGGQDLNLPVTYRSSMNYGIGSSQTITDPKKPSQTIGIIASDSQGRSVTEIFSGRGSKIAVQSSAPPNNGYMQTTLSLVVPAGKELALLHLHAITTGPDAGQKFAAGLKESQLLSGVPKQIRKLIANYSGSNLFIGDGDVEILRGDAFDTAEMRGGDTMKGTLKETSWKLKTFYGAVELPADKVICLINIGDSRPRQLLVTADGQVFGGRLEKETVDLELSSGQITKLPLGQVSRIGYRKRVGEPDEWTFDKPTLLLRSGERIAVAMPTDDLAVMTRYGLLKLKPATISTIAFQNDENGVHEIYLTDGSKFAGLVTAASFDLHLIDGKDQIVKVPTSAISKLQFTSKVDDAEDSTASLKLANEDLLVGSLSSEYKLLTAFDTLSLKGEQIKSISHSKTSPLDVTVRLWDESSFSGQLEEQDLACQLKSGILIHVPVALMAEYSQPQPNPADAMLEQVRQIVEKLNADDPKVREDAQKKLIAMGPTIGPMLKKMRPDQPPEAQQRIDSVLLTFKGPAPAPTNAAPEN
jgi:hypothetical protein